MEGLEIFKSVTYNLSDLVKDVKFFYENGESVSINDLSSKPRTIGTQNYGRCYEIRLINKNLSLSFAKVYQNRKLAVFLGTPFHFHTKSRPHVRVNTIVGRDMLVPVTYEILKTNYDTKCRKYPNIYTGSYDACKTIFMEEMLQTNFNCTVPFLMTSGNLCVGRAAKRASAMYNKYMNRVSLQCPRPCSNIISTFGMSRSYKTNKASTKFYFKDIVKVTEDFVSYDMLRSRLYTLYQIKYSHCFLHFSMVAEIGGYSGLLIGFSLMDLAMLLKKAASLIVKIK